MLCFYSLFTRKSLGDWSYDASELSEKINQVNSHKNARLTIERRKLLIERVAVMGLIPAAIVLLRLLQRYIRLGDDALPQRALVGVVLFEFLNAKRGCRPCTKGFDARDDIGPLNEALDFGV